MTSDSDSAPRSPELPSSGHRAAPVIPLPPRPSRADRAAPPGSWRARFQAALLFVSWSVAVGLLAGALMRLVFYDRAVLLIWFNAFTLYVYLPIYAILFAALLRRRWFLAVVSATVAGLHLFWVVPDFLPLIWHPATASTRAASGRTVRVVFHNVYAWSRAFDATFDGIESVDPDVCVLSEYSRSWHQAAARRDLRDRFPFRTMPDDRFTASDVLYSKWPFSKVRRHWLVPHHRLLLDVTLDVDGAPLRIFCVHAPRPVLGEPKQPEIEYDAYFRNLLALIDATTGPLLVIGDFNATQHARWYRQLTAGRLRAAHSIVGRGYATSWPNGKSWLPAIRIDHALLSPEIACIRVAEGESVGSDHKMLIVDLRLPAGSTKKE